ncbi:MAG: 2-oxoacid:acceptor oxidoreductase family protein, partial [Candidatus Hodarchaeota archaeon]
MTRTEIRLSGFGGQGIALAAKILSKAIAVYGGKNAIFTQSYGPESRGGASSANIVVDTEEIDFPYPI